MLSLSIIIIQIYMQFEFRPYARMLVSIGNQIMLESSVAIVAWALSFLMTCYGQ